MLPNLEIREFRTFRHLQIERLGRVNLIVGKNNVGKTSLLEALQLYAHRASPTLIWQILGTHDERRYSLGVRNGRSYLSSTRSVIGVDDLLSAFKYLFYG